MNYNVFLVMITMHCVTSNIQRGVSLDCNTNFTNVIHSITNVTPEMYYLIVKQILLMKCLTLYI